MEASMYSEQHANTHELVTFHIPEIRIPKQFSRRKITRET